MNQINTTEHPEGMSEISRRLSESAKVGQVGAQPQPEGGEAKSEEKKDEGVIDAEVVDEKK